MSIDYPLGSIVEIDIERNVAYILLRPSRELKVTKSKGLKVTRSRGLTDEIIIDFNGEEIVGIEILDATRHLNLLMQSVVTREKLNERT